MKSFKIYYINLDKSTKRREFMEDQFKKLNISASRISAIYGKELDNEFLKNEKKKTPHFSSFPITK